ncbi:integrase [Brucella intermedia]|uniref:integrase n=1 Tax=Brucella intermedia TaxID=94625 RepID=UPI000DE291BC|nr:integrase [Brucella intermedia]
MSRTTRANATFSPSVEICDWLAAGVHPKIASERLGHPTIGITLDLYSHVMPGMQANAAAQIDAMISNAVAKKGK